MEANEMHVKFLLYLESTYRFHEEKQRLELIKFAEERLPAFLRSNGYPDFGDIYDNMDQTFWDSIVTDGLPNETEEQRDYTHNVMESIKYIKGFIKFDKTANYKKLLADRLKREQQKNAQSADSGTSAQTVDYTQPEAENQVRKEGAVSQVSVTHYERNPEDRKKALERDGYECQVCHMKFVETYGEIGKEYIEVHHLYPVCNMGENYQFDPLDPEKGLVCLCSNCHSMIHRGGHYEDIDGERKMVPMTLKELQEVYNNNNASNS